jgi:outer membrane biosynthesis protein TonB
MTNPNLRDREVYNREIRRENQVIREGDGATAASGMLLGIILTAIAGIVAAAFYFANQKPTTQSPSRTTIIERTKETVKPQPAPNVDVNIPNPPPVEVPDVNVNVSPNPAPSAPVDSGTQQQPAPATETAPSQSGQ